MSILDNGRNGLLVPVGDKDALVRAIISFLEEPEFRNAVGRMQPMFPKVSSNAILKKCGNGNRRRSLMNRFWSSALRFLPDETYFLKYWYHFKSFRP